MLLVMKNQSEVDALMSAINMSMRIALGQFHYMRGVISETNLFEIDESLFKHITNRFDECYYSIRSMQMTPSLSYSSQRAKELFSLEEDILMRLMSNSDGTFEVTITDDQIYLLQTTLETYARVGMYQFDMVGMMFDHALIKNHSHNKTIASTLKRIDEKLKDIYSQTNFLATGIAVIESNPKFIGAWNLYQQMKNGTVHSIQQEKNKMVEVTFEIKEVHTATYTSEIPQYLAGRVVEMTPEEQTQFAKNHLMDYVKNLSLVDNSLKFDSIDYDTITNFELS